MVQVIDDPATAYRRVALDARVEGSDGAELTRLCLEQALAEIARARGATDLSRRTDALTRGAAALLALQEGVAPANPLRRALVQFYGGVRASLLGAIRAPGNAELAQAERDLAEVLALL